MHRGPAALILLLGISRWIFSLKMTRRRTIFMTCYECITSKCVSASPSPGRPSVPREPRVGNVLRQHVGSGYTVNKKDWSVSSGCSQSDGAATRIGSRGYECSERTRKPAVPMPLHLLVSGHPTCFRLIQCLFINSAKTQQCRGGTKVTATHPTSDISKGPWTWLCSWET